MALEIVRSDDFIEYFLFPQFEQLAEQQENEALNNVLLKAVEIATSYTKDYIWHKDPFALTVRNRSSHLLNPENKGESCL